MHSKLLKLQRSLKQKNEIYSFWRINNLIKLAEEKDAKDLIQINLRLLQEQSPKPDNIEPRDYFTSLQQQAKNGPYFSNSTLSFIKDLPEYSLPRGNRKGFIKWLANQMEKDTSGTTLFFDDIQYLSDWLDGINWPENPIDLDLISFTEAQDQAVLWHQNLWQAEGQLGGETELKSKDIIYQFKNGYTIVRVPASDLQAEGNQMGHCVGGYCDVVEEGKAEILSLRDPNNKPHATLQVSQDHVIQIKGKQNSPPIITYANLIREFLEQSDLIYKDNSDFKALPHDKQTAINAKSDPQEYFLKHYHLLYPDTLDKSMAQEFLNLFDELEPYRTYQKVPLSQTLLSFLSKEEIINLFHRTNTQLAPSNLADLKEWQNQDLTLPAPSKAFGEPDVHPINSFLENLPSSEWPKMAEQKPIQFALLFHKALNFINRNSQNINNLYPALNILFDNSSNDKFLSDLAEVSSWHLSGQKVLRDIAALIYYNFDKEEMREDPAGRSLLPRLKEILGK